MDDRARAETFDNFLDHARAYLGEKRIKEAGVIAGVVFEPLPQDRREIVVRELEPLLATAETPADALPEYSREYGVRFRAYDGSGPSVRFEAGEPAKYFFYEKADGTSYLVDAKPRSNRLLHATAGNTRACAMALGVTVPGVLI
jgi:hypothetical protein